MRVDEDGRRGSGPLYAMGLNFSMTGVFYNKELAAQIGMTERARRPWPSSTTRSQKAKDAGITPIAQFNGGATGGLAFPLQGLMASYGDPAEINAWTTSSPAPRSTRRDQPRRPPSTCSGGSTAGYFADDVNSLDYSMMMSRFIGGEACSSSTATGSRGTSTPRCRATSGFFLVPPVEEGGEVGAMSAPLTYGISANAENPDCAAFFLDWVATDDDRAHHRRRGRRLAPDGPGRRVHARGRPTTP